MKKSLFLLFTVLFFTLIGCTDNVPQNHFSETVKVALRDVGNKLMLASNDSTSLILPIIKTGDNLYEISFQNTLSIAPDSLVAFTKQSLNAAKLPKRYIVEVINCENEEVSYSYQITGLNENDIIPCLERKLPNDCYTIKVLFLENKTFSIFKNPLFIFLLLIAILGRFWWLQKMKKFNKTDTSNNNLPYSKIGHYRFYKDQNKLTKESVEIKLSVKECELMTILSANQNQVVKREVLVKEIWEDNGVFVDRSLDTFISKLRKKFKDDTTINIINIHGVGYKLEVS